MTALSTRLGLFVILLALLGCDPEGRLNFLVLESDRRANERVISGSIESVSKSVQASLNALGMTAQVTRQGDTIYVASSTRTGDKFKFVLKKEKGGTVEQTRIRIDWESGRDDQMGFQILSMLEGQARRE